MRPLARLRLATCLVALALPTGVHAQKPPPEPPTQGARDAARAYAEKGYELYEAGKYAEAMDHFRLAEERFHASPHLLFIARSFVKLGKLVDGRDAYAKVIAERLANYAPDAFRQAQADARRELDELQPRIPTIRLVLVGADASSVRVTVDGAEIPSSKIHDRLAVDPGAHTVVATKPGAPPFERSLTVAEGAAETVELRLSDTAAPAPTPATADQPPTNPTLLPAIIAFSVGGVALGIGIVTGTMSLAKVSDIEDTCADAPGSDTKVCDPKFRSDADDARTMGTVSTIGFVVGGVGIAAGVVLLVTGMKRDASLPSGAQPARAAASVRPLLGVGSIGLAGTF